jgi:hypothetical protein
VDDRGLELSANSHGNPGGSTKSGAESGAVGPENDAETAGGSAENVGSNDPGLARVIAAWPTLPDGIKTGILVMIEVAAGKH